jgi:amino acid adenylation domain-containing protein
MMNEQENVQLLRQSIRPKRVRPRGPFIEFKKEEIEQSLSDRFEQQVLRYPERLAVKTRSHAFTYDELNKAANRVARAIVEHAGEGEEPIALLFEHGAPVIAAIFGVLKTGKFYVPLDPLYPRARNAYMLENTQASVLVTNNQNLSLARELAQPKCQLINLDELDSTLSTDNLGLSISPDGLAYLLYTSGSTGQPKGVMQNHRNSLHKIMRNTNDYHICADDRVTLLFSYSFGTAESDIYGALLNGAALLPLDLKAEGMGNLSNWLLKEEITIYHPGPTLFRHFLSTLTGGEKFPKLRLIKLSGEPVYKRDLELYKKHFSPDCIFVNSLGATETGQFRHYLLDKDSQITSSIVPVGYAVEDKEVLLLDDAGQEVGFNHIGEIMVRSRYLSPGYWRAPDLTQSAFLPDPNGGDELIYRTRDLGLMLPDGCLMHMGRKDFQVKVRGHRVELAEIEMGLRNIDNIKEAVVILREDHLDDQHLVAYLVPAEKPAPTISALRRALAAQLPDYMVPSAFVLLDALPLTPNGKVDRRALPMPERARPSLEDAFVAPRTPVEEGLTEIWAQVLGVEQVGIHDNFFDLGGHSLLATQVMSRLRNTFQVELPLRSLFDAPTLASLALAVSQCQAEQAEHAEIGHLLAELEGLPDEEARRLLANGRE